MDKLNIFINRLEKININIKLEGNHPWIYIKSINNKRVKEKFQANHGFTLAFKKSGNGLIFTDLSEIFKLIRKYR